MNQQYTVDLTPARGRLNTWHVEETLSVMMPVKTPNGVKMVAVSPDNEMGMNLIPALLIAGVAHFSPERVDLAEQLFAHEIGQNGTALAPASPRQMTIYGGDGRAAKTGAMIISTGLQGAQARVQKVREQVKVDSLYPTLMATAPIRTFTASVIGGMYGEGVMFAGNPMVVPAYRGKMRGTALNPVDPAGFLNAPWHNTDAATYLVDLARQANEYQAHSIPCQATFQDRQRAQRTWHKLVAQADQLAAEFLNDTMPTWMPRGQWTPSVVPGQEDIVQVGRAIMADQLPRPEQTVGGCHRLAG